MVLPFNPLFEVVENRRVEIEPGRVVDAETETDLHAATLAASLLGDDQSAGAGQRFVG